MDNNNERGNEKKFVFQNDAAARYIFFALQNDNQGFEDFSIQFSSSQVIKDIYYDTPNFDLMRSGQCYRRREIMSDSKPPCHLQTIKKRVLCENTYQFVKDDKVLTEEDFRGSAVQYTLVLSAKKCEVSRVINIQTFRMGFSVVSTNGVEIGELHLDKSTAYDTNGIATREFYEIELGYDERHTNEMEGVADYLKNTFNLIPIRRSKLERSTGITIQNSPFLIDSAHVDVIMDMDPGVDDILAILFALMSRNISIKAITIVGGNAPGKNCALNALRTVYFVRKTQDTFEVPRIALGLDNSGRPPDATDVHGLDGMSGKSEFFRVTNSDGSSVDECSLIETDAKETVKELLQSAKRKITLLCTGPLTNVKHWIDDDELGRLIKEKIDKIVVMGGVFFDCGNRSQNAEFNIYSDPVAAKKVVEFCRGADDKAEPDVPLIFVGLDVTHKVRLRRKSLEGLQDNNPMKQFLLGITECYMDFYNRNEGLDGCYLHDPLAVGYVVDPTLCEIERFHVEIETRGEWTSGMTVGDFRPTRIFKKTEREKTWVCFKVDAHRFEKLFLERITGKH